MGVATTVRSVADALEDAARWRADEDSRHKAQMVEVEQQLVELRQAIAGLQDKLDALVQFRDGLAEKASTSTGEIQRAHDGLFAALEEQCDALEARTAELRRAEAKRLEMLETVLESSDLAGQLQEYRQFKATVEPTLASMPESFRSVVLAHRDKVASALEARVAELMADPVHAQGEKLSLEVAYAVDAPDDQPELVVVVTPISASTHEGWRDREEDLQTRLAARVVQAVYEACHEVGLETVQVAGGGHRGLLAIEADVVGAPARLAEVLGERLNKAFRGALELTAGKVQVTPRQVDADHVFGPMEEDDEEVLDVE